MAKTKTTKTERTPLLTTHAPTTVAPSVTRSVMLVTPALAAEWLKSNTRNRALRMPKVRRFADEIAAGRWCVTHQGIAFGADGTLYDGQHRLHAIVMAGVAVEVEVTRGLPPSALDVIDYGGDARRAEDIIAIADGVKLTSRQKARLVVASTLIEHGNLNHVEPSTPQSLRRVLTAHGAALAAVETVFGIGHGARLTPASLIGSIMVAWRSEPKAALAFLSALKSGAALQASHPVLALRNFLINTEISRSGGVAGREALSLRTFGAFDAYVRGDDLQALRANAGARDRYVAAWKRANG